MKEHGTLHASEHVLHADCHTGVIAIMDLHAQTCAITFVDVVGERGVTHCFLAQARSGHPKIIGNWKQLLYCPLM